ncbi:dTDP-4-dehydrorhamnose reductase [Marininema mesophilum]|uniref:dTDP-4-dehydrorhamnose reductase n=1 Tax=Marininema mesophilum TaxID=1048340 RepID=A0A1H2ZJG3_9BACL|nr:dTDP-4-dehydrorhamnose reductase [Marininema mesophilum]SDX16849.1 dTDP-4-dehydrorhamnose reductase [Marininema mesophilum]
MRIWVTGAGGQLGKDMVRILGEEHQVVGFTRLGWDVAESGLSQKLISSDPPEVIVHCAAYTNVDGSEDHPKEAFLVNTRGTKELAKTCGELGIRLVYISTDYVFDGEKESGYSELDPLFPLNVYGKTKAMGERWVEKHCTDYLILRTAWVYGHSGRNFPCAIIQKAQQGEVLRVVDDQRGSPTYTKHLAAKTRELLRSSLCGTFHTAGSGDCTWYDFAMEILRRAGYTKPLLTRISSRELSRRAKRPTVSILRTERLPLQGIEPLASWKKGLDDFFKERTVNRVD